MQVGNTVKYVNDYIIGTGGGSPPFVKGDNYIIASVDTENDLIKLMGYHGYWSMYRFVLANDLKQPDIKYIGDSNFSSSKANKEVACRAPACGKMNDFGVKSCWCCGNKI